MTTKSVSGQFADLDAKRKRHLERGRRCAANSIPSILPEPDQTDGGDIPDNHQSDCARWVSGLAGTLLQSTFPPGAPFASQQLAPSLDRDESISDEVKQTIKDRLFLQDIAIQAALESGGTVQKNELVAGFHDAQRHAFEQILVCGDVCQELTDDFRVKNYRLDNYGVLRDSTGRLLQLITRQEIDPGSFDEDELKKAELTQEKVMEKSVSERLVKVYDRMEWHPFSELWVTVREATIDGKAVVINEFEDKVPAKWSVPYRLTSGNHYGDGLCGLNFGDIIKLDFLCNKLSDHADLASWFHLFIDPSSDLTEDDMLSTNGRVSYGRVENGEAADVALFKADKVSDFTITKQVRDDVREALGRAFLSSTGSVRDSERTTQYEVAATTIQELNNGTGGVYASIATNMQANLFARARFEAVRQKIIRPIPSKLIGRAVQTVPLTGLAALAAQARFQSILSFADLIQKLGPRYSARLDEGILTRVAARYFLVNEPGLIKTDAQVKADLEAAIQAQNRQAAGQQAVTTLGNIAEQQAAASAQQPAA